MELPAAFAGGFKDAIKITPEAKAAAIQAYGSQEAYDAHVTTDAVFGEPARALARDHAISGHPTWLYRFSVVSAGAPKVLQGARCMRRTGSMCSRPCRNRPGPQTRGMRRWPRPSAPTGSRSPRPAIRMGDGRPHWPAYNSKDMLVNFTNAGPVAEATPDAHALDAIAESYAHR